MLVRVLIALLGAVVLTEAALAADRAPAVALDRAGGVERAHLGSTEIVPGSSRIFAFAPPDRRSLAVRPVIAPRRTPMGFNFSEPGWPLSMGPRD